MKTADTVVLTIHCPTREDTSVSDYLTEVLWALPDVCSVEEVYSGPLHEQFISAVRLFIGDAEDNASHLTKLEASVNNLLQTHDILKDCRIETVKQVSKEDWAESWKQFWHVTAITPHLTICPTWERMAYEPKPDEVVLQLDPGCAFGTGSHETTRLMLRNMEQLSYERPFEERSILDLGCGSGVLAVYAALLGGSDIMALDIEPEAVQMTQDNAKLNQVNHCIEVRDTPLIDMCQTRYDLILANIVAPVLLALMDDIVLRMAPGGEVLLSGLVEKSVGIVEESLKLAGFESIKRVQDGDWFLLRGRFPA